MNTVNRNLSERFPSYAALFFSTLLAAFVAGGVYAFVAWLIPFLLLVVFLTFGLAGFIGWLTATLAVNLNVRSFWFLICVSVAAGLTALYASWGTNAGLRVPGLLLAGFDPLVLFEYAKFLYENSTFEIGVEGRNTVFQGPRLALLWLLEAAVIVIGSARIATSTYKSSVMQLCPLCNARLKRKSGILRLGIPEDFPFDSEEYSSEKFDWIDELPDGSVDDDPHIRIDVCWCMQCNGTCSASASVISYSSQPGEIAICSNIPIDTKQLEEILQRAKEQEAAAEKVPELEEDDADE